MIIEVIDFKIFVYINLFNLSFYFNFIIILFILYFDVSIYLFFIIIDNIKLVFHYYHMIVTDIDEVNDASVFLNTYVSFYFMRLHRFE